MTTSDSSLITNHEYYHNLRRLTLTFRKGGNVVHYHGVEPDIAEAFAAHPSQGSFFHATIKDKFHHTPG